MIKKLPILICITVLTCCWFTVYSQVSVSVMSIKGAEIKRLMSIYSSGITVLQFKTNDADTFFVDASVYNTNVNPPFSAIPLQRLKTITIPVDTFVLSTLKWNFSFDSIPGGLDTSKTYYLVPYYQNPYVLYKFSLYSLEDLIKKANVSGYKNLSAEMLNKLDAETRKRILEQVNKILAAAATFNPVPPQLLP